jgi:hypothetical protein
MNKQIGLCRTAYQQMGSDDEGAEVIPLNYTYGQVGSESDKELGRSIDLDAESSMPIHKAP